LSCLWPGIKLMLRPGTAHRHPWHPWHFHSGRKTRLVFTFGLGSGSVGLWLCGPVWVSFLSDVH